MHFVFRPSTAFSAAAQAIKLLTFASLAVSISFQPMCGQDQTPTTLLVSGFVTSAATPAQFQVNAMPITCEAGRTRSVVVDHELSHSIVACPQRELGEAVKVYGTKSKGTGVIFASSVETEMPYDVPVAGYAIVDKVLTPLHESRVVLRADGYALAIEPSTTLSSDEGTIKVLSEVKPNIWMSYKGVLRKDGTVLASYAEFRPNVIDKPEDKLRKSNEFDASQVQEEDRQGRFSKNVLGWDMKRIPAYSDTTMQERISTIGEKLVPAYQRKLADYEPTKIDFRFQLVDQPKLNDLIALPSGIILVPYQLMQRLNNDSQIAAVLGSGIATVLDKQALRVIPAKRAMTATDWAGAAAGIFVPGAGLATSIGTSKAKSVIERHQLEQRDRVGLALMSEAGYDLPQAPLAWWSLRVKDSKSLANTSMPYSAQYLYGLLAKLYKADSASNAATNLQKAAD